MFVLFWYTQPKRIWKIMKKWLLKIKETRKADGNLHSSNEVDRDRERRKKIEGTLKIKRGERYFLVTTELEEKEFDLSKVNKSVAE
ncbi:hypothetical protein pdam_00025411 [Pocillopora damicornis]|uniref:Uncharacterized protein n=1 Tax=Pocillopora damicornis TaxID=46731 RepID=A0A3M6UIF6_POCDA|nr:hypothetical protein pdam_00025411 [Pocillopora damicornis]